MLGSYGSGMSRKRKTKSETSCTRHQDVSRPFEGGNRSSAMKRVLYLSCVRRENQGVRGPRKKKTNHEEKPGRQNGNRGETTRQTRMQPGKSRFSRRDRSPQGGAKRVGTALFEKETEIIRKGGRPLSDEEGPGLIFDRKHFSHCQEVVRKGKKKN